MKLSLLFSSLNTSLTTFASACVPLYECSDLVAYITAMLRTAIKSFAELTLASGIFKTTKRLH